MSQPNQPNLTPDDLLADFTDRVLNGKTSAPASPADVELRALEETVLRLNGILPQEAPDPQTLKRMQADFKVRARKAGASTPSIWQSLRRPQRFALAFAGAVLATLLIVLPFLPSTGDPVQGTAGLQPRDAILLAGIGCVIVLLIWVRRRK
ncbi:MAG TPA: hypothetical protein VK880_10140 [Anaerolineales bacterium]|nr:hypothetical protein [Anaerolineales bacterium]